MAMNTDGWGVLQQQLKSLREENAQLKGDLYALRVSTTREDKPTADELFTKIRERGIVLLGVSPCASGVQATWHLNFVEMQNSLGTTRGRDSYRWVEGDSIVEVLEKILDEADLAEKYIEAVKKGGK